MRWWIAALVLAQLLWGWSFIERHYVGERAEIINEIGKPYAVLTVNYGEPVRGFMEGEFYVLKVLQVRGNRVDYGFCPVKRDAFYAKD